MAGWPYPRKGEGGFNSEVRHHLRQIVNKETPWSLGGPRRIRVIWNVSCRLCCRISFPRNDHPEKHSIPTQGLSGSAHERQESEAHVRFSGIRHHALKELLP